MNKTEIFECDVDSRDHLGMDLVEDGADFWINIDGYKTECIAVDRKNLYRMYQSLKEVFE